MYLVDTSIWIDFFRGIKNNSQKQFLEILDQQLPLGLTPVIFQEVLQGARTLKDFKMLQEYLGSQRFYLSQNPLESAEFAAKIYFQCRQKGLTIRSTLDCMIAQSAIENNLILLHNDKDFSQIAKIDKRLRLL
jgi:predicted nucleic acid-binding protein